MIKEVEKIVTCFRSCFSREAAFHWFVIVVFAMIVRVDHHGVTSIVRWLVLDPTHYSTLLWFFRARSWKLEDVREQWCQVVKEKFPLAYVNGRAVLLGDTIKIAKLAEQMPAVKRLHQEENMATKPEYILGHHHGVVGVLVQSVAKQLCVPVAAELQEGMTEIRRLQGKATPSAPKGKEDARPTLVTRMADLVLAVIGALGMPSYVVLDAFYAAQTLFKRLAPAVAESSPRWAHAIVKGKRSYVGYRAVPPVTGKRPVGRPPQYGEKVKLWDLFETAAEKFVARSLNLYGAVHPVQYLCLDLLWKPIGEKIRCVLDLDEDRRYLRMCSDLTLAPEAIIGLYATRFKVEGTLKMLKGLLGAFFYHFWTSVWPTGARPGVVDLTGIKVGSPTARLIGATTDAIERFVNLACLALGILQYLAVVFPERIWQQYTGWLRTRTSVIPSEEVVQAVVQREVFFNFFRFKSGLIYRVIQAKRRAAAPGAQKKVA